MNKVRLLPRCRYFPTRFPRDTSIYDKSHVQFIIKKA